MAGPELLIIYLDGMVYGEHHVDEVFDDHEHHREPEWHGAAADTARESLAGWCCAGPSVLS